MTIAVGILSILALLIVFRMLIGPTIWDRLLCVNLLTSKVLMILVILAYLNEQNYMIDFAIIYALLGFIGIMFIAISIQKRGKLF